MKSGAKKMTLLRRKYLYFLIILAYVIKTSIKLLRFAATWQMGRSANLGNRAVCIPSVGEGGKVNWQAQYVNTIHHKDVSR